MLRNEPSSRIGAQDDSLRGSLTIPQPLSTCCLILQVSSHSCSLQQGGLDFLRGDAGLQGPGLPDTWARMTQTSLPLAKQSQALPSPGKEGLCIRGGQNCRGPFGDPLAQVLLSGANTQGQGVGSTAVVKCCSFAIYSFINNCWPSTPPHDPATKSSIWQSGGLLRPVPVLSIAGAYGLVVGKHFAYHSTLSSNAQ